MTNTIPNPMDMQREELIVARIARDMARAELEEIALALEVRANIKSDGDVAGAVNELLDEWERMCAKEHQQFVDELREQLKAHKSDLMLASELRQRLGETDAWEVLNAYRKGNQSNGE